MARQGIIFHNIMARLVVLRFGEIWSGISMVGHDMFWFGRVR
jgi:hypothetical protein